MTSTISDDIAQIDKTTVAFVAFSGAATALGGIAGLAAAGAGVI
jgi:small-conductance mechanosensitive channel